MTSRLVELILGLTELMEAEGASLRRNLVRLIYALGLATVAAVSATAGIALAIVALYQYVAVHAGSAVAFLSCAFLALAIAGVLVRLLHGVADES